MNGNVEYISYNEKYGIVRNTSSSGNLSEPSSNCFLDEYSNMPITGKVGSPSNLVLKAHQQGGLKIFTRSSM